MVNGADEPGHKSVQWDSINAVSGVLQTTGGRFYTNEETDSTTLNTATRRLLRDLLGFGTSWVHVEASYDPPPGVNTFPPPDPIRTLTKFGRYCPRIPPPLD